MTKNKKSNWIVFFCIASIGCFCLSSCKDKEEGDVVANFNMSAKTAKEGELVVINSTSENATKIEWKIANNLLSSTASKIEYTFDTTGKFPISLKAIGANAKSSTKTDTILVQPDTLYRIRGKLSKTWIPIQILNGSIDLLADACKKDDEITFYESGLRDTISYGFGKDTCEPGAYTFEIPSGAQWRYNASKKTLELAVVVAGNPITLSFAIIKFTNSYFEGRDNLLDVTIKLRKK